MRGIYEIRNTTTGEFYIGRSDSVLSRWKDHMHHLERGRHDSKALQSAWDTHGPSAFTFKVLEVIPDAAECIRREIEIIEALQPAYNSVGTERYLEIIRKPRDKQPHPQRQEQTKVRIINGGTHSVEPEEIGIWTCPACGKSYMEVGGLNGKHIVEATKERVTTRLWASVIGGLFDDRVRGIDEIGSRGNDPSVVAARARCRTEHEKTCEGLDEEFSCLACGAGHRIIACNGEVTLERYEY